MKKVIISGSSKLQEKVEYWKKHFEDKGLNILDWPKVVAIEDEMKDLPIIYRSFYTAIENADVFFLMNEERKGIKGYVGASAISELTYAVIQNLLHGKDIQIYILNMPDKEVSSYDEIRFWLDAGWIKLYNKEI